MSDLGYIKPAQPDFLKLLTGVLITPERRIAIVLEGDPSLIDARTPSHHIFERTATGERLPIGKAWLKKAKAGPKPGTLFFSISIEGPFIPHRLNVAAYADEAGGFVLTWRSRQSKAAA